ncbi:hypothetical protein JCM17380_02100 [Desulfosporosinus burensis]
MSACPTFSLKTVGKKNKNRIKLLITLMVIDDEIEENSSFVNSKSWSYGLVDNHELST